MQSEIPTLFDLNRDKYIDRLKPLFMPVDQVSNDIVRYFASLQASLHEPAVADDD